MSPKKTLSIHPLLVICFMLSVALGALLILPIHFWIDYIRPIIMCASFVVFFLDVYVGLISQQNRNTINNLVSQYNTLWAKNKELKETASMYSSKVYEVEYLKDEQKDLNQEIQKLQRQNRYMNSLVRDYKKLYMSSSLESTRRYASECFNFDECLELFDPIKYIRNPNYARVIDTNAEELTTILLGKSDGISIDNTHLVIRRLNELLNDSSLTTNTSSLPLIERNTLTKINGVRER